MNWLFHTPDTQLTGGRRAPTLLPPGSGDLATLGIVAPTRADQYQIYGAKLFKRFNAVVGAVRVTVQAFCADLTPF